MEILYRLSSRQINQAPQQQRKVLLEVKREAQLNVILGLRGVGKTTFLLQEAKKLYDQNKSVLYISLDDFYFLDSSPLDVIEQFYAEGGEYLFIDEVHYYEEWSRLLKRTYDLYPRLKVWATGSSAIKIHEGKADLGGRRGHYYTMPGMSFREYAFRHYGQEPFHRVYTLDELIENRIEIGNLIGKFQGIRKHFHDYLETGYFPFTVFNHGDHLLQISQMLQGIFEVDLRLIKRFDPRDSRQTLAFLKFVAASVPYELNISKLSQKIGFNRNKLLEYIYVLEQGDIVNLLNDPTTKQGSFTKPDKIYLSNPNFYHALNPYHVNKGSVREAFAMNQLKLTNQEVALHPTADFLVNDKYVFEIGGKSKNLKQIAGMEHGYIFADNLEHAYGKRLPLWMLGLLY